MHKEYLCSNKIEHPHHTLVDVELGQQVLDHLVPAYHSEHFKHSQYPNVPVQPWKTRQPGQLDILSTLNRLLDQLNGHTRDQVEEEPAFNIVYGYQSQIDHGQALIVLIRAHEIDENIYDEQGIHEKIQVLPEGPRLADSQRLEEAN